jgi:hypothetical protein
VDRSGWTAVAAKHAASGVAVFYQNRQHVLISKLMGDAQNCSESDLGPDFIGTLVPEFQLMCAQYCGNEAVQVPASPARLAHVPQRRGPAVPALHALRHLPGEIHPDRLQGGLGLVAISNTGVPLNYGELERWKHGETLRAGVDTIQ